MNALQLALRAAGIGRAEKNPPPRRPIDVYLFRSVYLNPWKNRMRGGYALCWDSPFWHHAVGIPTAGYLEHGRDPAAWHRHGPVAHCRYRRRGSLLSDMHFERAMGCNCRHLTKRWLQGRGQVKHGLLCNTLNESS
jgi:hypothetical protein